MNISRLVFNFDRILRYFKAFKDLLKIKKNNANNISKLYSILVFKKTDTSNGIVYKISQ
jgi:hypothetical protein